MAIYSTGGIGLFKLARAQVMHCAVAGGARSQPAEEKEEEHTAPHPHVTITSLSRSLSNLAHFSHQVATDSGHNS